MHWHGVSCTWGSNRGSKRLLHISKGLLRIYFLFCLCHCNWGTKTLIQSRQYRYCEIRRSVWSFCYFPPTVRKHDGLNCCRGVRVNGVWVSVSTSVWDTFRVRENGGWNITVYVVPLCTLQTLVSQLQQLPHGGGHGGVKRLQIHHTEPLAPLHTHSDTSSIPEALKLDQTHRCTAHTSPLRVCGFLVKE